jgi:hypothetical protein
MTACALALSAAAPTQAAFVGFTVTYAGMNGGVHVYWVFANFNQADDAVIGLYDFQLLAGTMAPVAHEDNSGFQSGPAWDPRNTIGSQVARDSYVTVNGVTGSNSVTQLAGFGNDIGIANGASWSSMGSPSAVGATNRVRIAQFAGAFEPGMGFFARLTVRYREAPNATTVLEGTSEFQVGSGDCFARARSVSSPALVPYSFENPRQWTASGIAPSSSGALLTVSARGQLGTTTRFLTIKADDVILAVDVFGAGSGAGSCTAALGTIAIPISAAQFSELTADGALTIQVQPSLNATSAGCDTAMLGLRLDYVRDVIDCDGSGGDDECQILANPGALDCNANEALDSCDITSGTSVDVNANGRPDECEDDCNGNDLPDPWEISQGLVPDCNTNGIPDSCDIAQGGTSTDVDANGIPDDCKADCNNNGLPDAYEIAQGLVADCDSNAVPDSCQIAAVPNLDCNTDGILDSCQGGPNGSDCDGNGLPDICDIANGAEDKNDNGRLDSCELVYGDLNLDGQVNGTDLAGLLAVWGLPNPPYGDLDGDGQVGGSDLSFLLARWGPVP